jgi:hypothetical protein
VSAPAPVKEYFVTVRDGNRSGFLLGPYTTHQEALDLVDRGRDLACAANDRAWFYSYGTAGAPVGLIKETVFGK